MSGPRRRVAIIGAGPAGLFAAETLAQTGHAVTVYERMPSVGRKFLMAGRGGLNLTHSEPFDRFTRRYGVLPPALDAALAAFPPAALIAWCEGLGEPTFTGTSGRVFPQGFKASPLLRAWLRRLATLGVTLRTRHDWRGWDEEGRLVFATPDGSVTAAPDATVLALGGASWPRLGADGSWQAILGAAGAAIAPLQPANGGVRIGWSDHVAGRFAGTPLKRIAAACGDSHVRGEAMVTADGLEGGAIYALGPAIRAALAQGGSAPLMLDLRPDLTEAALAARLEDRGKGRSLATRLAKAGLPPVAAGLMREAQGGPLPADPLALARLAKATPLAVTGLAGLERAISTAGGVRFDALDGWMLRARPGLFLAGEMLDWDAPTGGYLLQACFASARAAATQAAAWLTR